MCSLKCFDNHELLPQVRFGIFPHRKVPAPSVLSAHAQPWQLLTGSVIQTEASSRHLSRLASCTYLVLLKVICGADCVRAHCLLQLSNTHHVAMPRIHYLFTS